MPILTFDPVEEFLRSLRNTLIHEGGYSNHPKDPGKGTMKGVTQRVYDEFRLSIKKALQDVRRITEDELQRIYKTRYWDVIKGDYLPSGLSYVLFDGAVNSGGGQSGKWLQRALKDMGLYRGQIDGLIGHGTLLAVSQVNDVDALISKVLDRRMAFLKALKTFSTFGKGWTSRVKSVLAVGQAWATGSVGPEVTYIPMANAKALVTDAKTKPVVGAADAAAGGGISFIGAGPMLKEAQEQIAPLAGTSQFIDTVMAALVMGGVVIALGGIAYRVYASRKGKALSDALDLEAVPA